MSDAPPPPPDPPAPPSDESTPMPYMTPHSAKQRHGLTPSALDLSKASGPSQASSSSTVASKSYRTTSRFLNVDSTGSNINSSSKSLSNHDGTVGLQRIVDAITETLYYFVDESEKATRDLTSLDFKEHGCKWLMEFNPSLRADALRLEVVCSAARSDMEETTYVVETSVQIKDPSIPTVASDPGEKEAKITFENVAHQVRKAVVRLEFPEFPEGCKGRPFREIYQLNARLKSGSFATVCRGTHRATGKKVAIKCVLRKDLPPSDDAAIFDEVAILASLDHPYICPIIDFFDEKDCYFIVMELMSGGDLFDRIGAKKTYSEADAQDLCRKMFQAIAFCHERNIAHCDMKPKNLLLSDEENDSLIKLADFGFAARVYGDRSLTKQCGTPFFVSPEILMRNGYDQKSDIWSVGCIVYLLLGGNLPFLGRSQKELFRAIVVGKYDFPEDCWGDVSDDAKDLVSKMLVTDPDQRISAIEALRHKWVRQDSRRLSLIQLKGTSMRLKSFNARMKLRSAMIAVDCISSLSRRGSWMSSKKLGDDAKSASEAAVDEDEDEDESKSKPSGLVALALKMKQNSISEES